MAQSKECEDNTQCDQSMRTYFPITKENAYGAIPMVGAITSCFSAGIIMQILSYAIRDMYWAGVWFCLGFLLMIGLQIFWGFHAEKQNFLLLWTICKSVETFVVVVGIILGSLGGGFIGILIILFGIIYLIVLVVLLRMACVRYKDLKKAQHNIHADLDKLVTK